MASRSLQRRFLRTLAWASCLLGALLALVVYRATQLHLHEGSVATVAALVAAIEKSAAVGVYAEDRELLREIAEGLRRHPHVAAVAVSGANGSELLALPLAGAAGAAAASQALPAPTARAAAEFDQRLSSPFDASEGIGRLQVWLDSRRMQSDARQQALLLVGALIVLLAGVMLVFQALAVRLLSRPMQRLAADLGHMAPGTDARLRVTPDHAHDEIGTVAAAANRLLELQQHALERERALRAEIAETEARYRGIFDSTRAGIFVLSGTGLMHGNPALGQMLGSTAGVRADWQADFVHAVACDPVQLTELIESARATGQPHSLDLELRRVDGELIWVHCLVSAQRTDDGLDRVEGVLYDITQRKQAERLAHHRAEHDALTGLKSRAYIEAALEHKVATAASTDEAVTLMFLDLDGFKAVNDRWGHAAGDEVLIEAARRLRSLFRRASDSVGRLGGDELVAVVDGMHATDPTVQELGMALIAAFRAPFDLPGGDQAYVGVSVGAASFPRHATTAKTLIEAADAAMYAVKQTGRGGFVIASLNQEGANGAAAPSATSAINEALRDPLTGLPDRRALAVKLDAALRRADQTNSISAVLALDIDQFKVVNVAHGSHVGDEVLCEVAWRLRQFLRAGEAAVRIGSDEFLVIVDTGEAEAGGAGAVAGSVGAKLQAAVAQPIHTARGPLALNASVGYSLMLPGAGDAQRVLLESQLALKRAKTAGQAHVVAFEPNMLAGLQLAMSLEADLRAAMAAGRFELHVQPQVHANGQRQRGEALLRWRHPARGWVPPSEFIPLAESTGLIVELGRWVLRQGCSILERAHRGGQRTELSINISPVQFRHPQFVADVREAIAEAAAPAEGLILEITETLLIQQVDEVVQRMRELVALGVRFSIDDFGTGFSSLGYLRHLPLHEIKIDRSFVSGLPGDAASAGIVQSILAMGQHLGLEVVAEGVETPAQSRFLRERGCLLEQGWLHGRPLPADEWLATLLADAAASGPASRRPVAESAKLAHR